MPASRVHPPPRFLLGASLLFWGAMTGRPFIGLFCAVLVELRHWVTIRWDFDDDDCGRAWQLTTVLVAIAAVLILLDGERSKALPVLLSWMPPLLLPMQFVQSYGLRDSIQLAVFSFLARKRRLRNQRLGLIEETVEVNFGNVYFFVIMVASAVGTHANQWWYVVGLAVLTGWIMAAISRGRLRVLVPTVLACGLLAVAGQFTLEVADDLIGRSYGGGYGRFNPNYNLTMIGNRGSVDLSSEVLWRLKTMPGVPAPKLLRTATYSRLKNEAWNNNLTVEDFEYLKTKLIGKDSHYLLLPVEASDRIPSLPAFTLRGSAVDESPLPLPGDAAGFRDFDLLGAERNMYGTVRISPRNPVIDGTVFWNGGTNVEESKPGFDDLRVPGEERNTDILHEAVTRLHLEEEPTIEGKLKRIRSWFLKDFTYTTHLTIPRHSEIKTERGTILPTAIGRFLSDIRAGHCEYFATAAVLMLRDAGIPARYTVGFAVAELDPKRGEFILRRKHSHAWCRVWDGSKGQWIDFDPTPSNWLLALQAGPDWQQRLSDRLKWLREDFFIWRNKPNNRLGVSLGMILVGLGLGSFIARRLWRSRRNLGNHTVYRGYGGPVIRTPLNDLEELAVKRLGPRPPGEPLGAWLGMLRASIQNQGLLDDAIALHQRLRFDPEPAGSEEFARLQELAREIQAELKARGG